jgi:hypothetical protein
LFCFVIFSKRTEEELRKTQQPKPEQLFNYAYYLVHAKNHQQVEKGISILTGIFVLLFILSILFYFFSFLNKNFCYDRFIIK